MVDGDGNGYKDGSYADSWVAANAGAPNNDQISDEFFGGWAGKCPPGQKWAKDPNNGEWSCSGVIQDWDQAVLVPDIEPGSGKETVGIVIMPYNFVEDASTGIEVTTDSGTTTFRNRLDTLSSEEVDLTSVRSYQESVADEDPQVSNPGDAPTLEQVNVKCYSDANPDSSFTKTKEINVDPDNPKPVAVTGKIELSGSNAYTCNWNYTSSDGERNPVWNAGTPVDISDSGAKNEVLFDFFKNDRGFSNLKKKEYSSNGLEEAASNWN